MKRVLPVLVGFALLLLSSTEGWSLPPCPDSPTSRWSTTSNWTDCFGTYTRGGTKYVGEWKDGKIHGQGEMSLYAGHKYVGQLENGKREGHGTETFASGDKYVGEFKDQVPDGEGTYTSADGRIEEGMFENGKFKYAKNPPPHSNCQEFTN